MKKFLAVLLTLVMALSICVPAFAADAGDTTPPDTEQGEGEKPSKPGFDLSGLADMDIKAMVEDFVNGKIDAKINATFIVLEGYLTTHPLPTDIPAGTVNYDEAYAKWEAECAEWVRNFIVGEGISVKAAKVAITNMYNKGTFTAAELRYAQEALRKEALQLQITDLVPAQADLNVEVKRVETLKAKLNEYKLQDAQLKAEYGENYPVAIQAEIDKLDDQYWDLVDAGHAEDSPECLELNAKIEVLEAKKNTRNEIESLPTSIESAQATVATKQKVVDAAKAKIDAPNQLSKKMSETYRLTADERTELEADLKYLEDNGNISAALGSNAFAYKDKIQANLDNQKLMSNAQFKTVMKSLDNFKESDLPPVIKTDVDENVYKLVCEAKDGKAVTDALTGLGLPIKLMPQAIDKLVGKKIILESVGKLGKASAAELMNPNADDTTKPDGTKPNTPNEDKPASGIGGFISSLLDKLKGGKDDANKGEVDNSENGNGPATGDVAIYSVLGLAAVAGAAVVLTKKKKNVK